MPTTINSIDTEKQRWIEDLANQVGREVEKLVQAAPEGPKQINAVADLLAAINVRKHMAGWYKLDHEEIFLNSAHDECVFVGELKTSMKVETYAQLRKMCNELTNVKEHPENTENAIAVVTASLSANYVASLKEVRVKDLSTDQLANTYLGRDENDLVTLFMRGKAFFADTEFGNLKKQEVLKDYNIVSFKIDRVTGSMISWFPGHDPQALPVESLEHEYVKIV